MFDLFINVEVVKLVDLWMIMDLLKFIICLKWGYFGYML